MNRDLRNLWEGGIRKHFRLILVGLFPVLLYFVNRDWVLGDNPFGNMIDPWIYNGYMLNFGHFYQMFGQTYYGDRIPWILPGYILHHLLPPVAANAILHLVFAILSVISLFLILKITVGERSAFVASIAMGAYPFFLRELGSNYPTGAVITYLLLTLLTTTLMITLPQKRLLLGLSGIFLVCMIFSNLFAVILLPFILAYYYFLIYNRLKKEISWFFFGYFIAGVLLATLAFSLVFFLFTKNPLFFKAQLYNAIFYSVSSYNPWFYPLGSWIFRAHWLLVPLFAFVASLTFLVVCKAKKISQNNRFISFFLISYIILVSLYFLFYFRKTSWLQFYYYADLLIPFAFLAMGSLVSFLVNRLEESHFNLISAFQVVLYLLPIIFVYSGFTFQLVLGLLAALVFYGLFFRKAMNPKPIILTIFIIILVYSMYVVVIHQDVGDAGGPSSFESYDRGYLAIMDATRSIENTIPPGGQVRFWYNARETKDGAHYGGLFNNVNSVYLWGYTGIGDAFPAIEKKNIDNLVNHRRNVLIVILTTAENGFQLAEESLNNIGYNATLLRTSEIEEGKVKFYCYFIYFDLILPRFDQANSTTLYQKGGGELISSLDRNIYGITVSPVIDSVKDTYVFHPTTVDDHLAIPFLPLQPSNGTQERFLQITLDMPKKPGIMNIRRSSSRTKDAIPSAPISCMTPL